jgi:hypothetical protein
LNIHQPTPQNKTGGRSIFFNFYFKKMYSATTATFATPLRLTPHQHHRDNNCNRHSPHNRHSPRQQAFTIPPPATTDRHSFISINGKLTSCSEVSAFRFQAYSI